MLLLKYVILQRLLHVVKQPQLELYGPIVECATCLEPWDPSGCVGVDIPWTGRELNPEFGGPRPSGSKALPGVTPAAFCINKKTTYFFLFYTFTSEYWLCSTCVTYRLNCLSGVKFVTDVGVHVGFGDASKLNCLPGTSLPLSAYQFNVSTQSSLFDPFVFLFLPRSASH